MTAPRSGEPRAGEGRELLLLGIAFHTLLLALMPFVVGGITGLFAEVSQVGETLGPLVRFASGLLLPVLILQFVSIWVKVRRERDALREGGELDLDASIRAVHRHVRVLTDKGLGMFFGGLLAVALALAFHFAELGITAVLALVTLYLLVAVAVVLSTFVVTRFEHRLAARGGTIGREFSPVIAESGDSVEERFHFERVPVPPGFNLRIHQELPARLATESRHVVGNSASQQRITLTRALRRTPRGDYRIGPAEVTYTDFFGLTRVAVANSAGARLKVMPRMHAVVLQEAPRSQSPEEGALNILRKLPTDDYFRFRDYSPGDDSRRIHWKLSVKVGKLQVRLPETVPITPRRVRLVLDTYLPMGLGDEDERSLILGDALDRITEAWLSLARALTDRGESVTLVLPTGDPERPVEEIECKRGTQPRWRDLGARARWQNITDFHQAAAAVTPKLFVAVVTARLSALPPLPQPQGAWLTWVFLPLLQEIPAEVPGSGKLGGHRMLDAMLQLFPPGAEENGMLAAIKRSQARRRLETLRVSVATSAIRDNAAIEAMIRARGEPFYKIRRSGATYVLDSR